MTDALFCGKCIESFSSASVRFVKLSTLLGHLKCGFPLFRLM